MKVRNMKKYENVKTVKTSFRKLENFLYLFGIAPLNTTKNWDGATVWEFEDTPQLRFAVEKFKEIEMTLRQMNEFA